ncbi:MAG TPA: peptide chain release factor N(5)-glutamine methyltransferase [Verrucomicrobiae bacterium]|nr:peptide chain release factor N(5)-glutamine methyltransferase [Verrucomicrobiae bacterium]
MPLEYNTYRLAVTVLEVIQRSTDFLAKKDVESPRLQVELLLSHVLKLPRMQLYLNFSRELAEPELANLRELVRRRGLREPLQHIVGSTSFCGLELKVTNHVLVPRPETELLAEFGWNFLKELHNANTNEITALDFGTGSGCLAITLAVKSPNAHVTALDISEDALAIARENAMGHQVESRIEFLQGDGLAALPASTQFNLIVANPPYISTGEIATLDAEVRDFDPRLALDGGADGLDFYRRISSEAPAFLKPNARIMLEFGDGQESEIQKIFESQKWIVEAVKADYSKRPRILIARAGESPASGAQ